MASQKFNLPNRAASLIKAPQDFPLNEQTEYMVSKVVKGIVKGVTTVKGFKAIDKASDKFFGPTITQISYYKTADSYSYGIVECVFTLSPDDFLVFAIKEQVEAARAKQTAKAI